jgi:Ca2+-binding RTX toxin-like protein
MPSKERLIQESAMLYKTDIGSHSSQYNIDNSNTIYTLATGDSIAVTSGDGIRETSNWHQNTININGAITANNSGQRAVYVSGTETRINVGDSAVIAGYYGVYASGGDYVRMTNDGSITGSSLAVTIQFSDHSRFVNNDTVDGEIVVDRSDDVSITLAHGSVLKNLSGSTTDIASDAGQKAHLVNGGDITATSWAIYGRDGDETIVNRGTIAGGILLGGGNDVFDNRGGSVDHLIYGGEGNDVFVLDKAVQLSEYAGEGMDMIRSTISMSLTNALYAGQEIENLTLLGTLNHKATGNALANVITGNAGNNVLSGLGGADHLVGGKGNDRLIGGLDADTLTGGKGHDTFVFRTGDGTDSVTDFHNGQDRFDLKAWAAITSFADLKAHHLSVSGSDVVIHAGADTLTIEHTTKAELDVSNFLF